MKLYWTEIYKVNFESPENSRELKFGFSFFFVLVRILCLSFYTFFLIKTLTFSRLFFNMARGEILKILESFLTFDTKVSIKKPTPDDVALLQEGGQVYYSFWMIVIKTQIKQTADALANFPLHLQNCIPDPFDKISQLKGCCFFYQTQMDQLRIKEIDLRLLW